MSTIARVLVTVTAVWWANGAHATPVLPDTPSQSASFTPADVDSGRVQPLDLRPGCWEVSQRTWITSGGLPKAQLDAARAQFEEARRKAREELEKDQRIPREQREAMLAAQKPYFDSLLKMLGTPATSGNDQPLVIVCTTTPFIGEGKDLYGTLKPGCHRSITSTGRTERMQVACQGRSSDYERTDAENFRSRTESWQAVAGDPTRRNALGSDTVAKWVGDASPHMPYRQPRTDLKGVRPIGEDAVAWLDRYRIVAVIDGKPITSLYGFMLRQLIPGSAAIEYGTRPSRVLEQIYMHDAVALEAVRLHLGAWDDASICNGSLGTIHCGPESDYNQMQRATVGDYPLDPGESTYDAKLRLLAASLQGQADRYQGAMERLWNAYFSQAKTPTERQALLAQVEHRYRIRVTDPDFFDDAHHPPEPTAH